MQTQESSGLDDFRNALLRRIAYLEDIEVDGDAKVSLAEEGAWVQAWVWVSDEEAGKL